jgi:hypothetical protein
MAEAKIAGGVERSGKLNPLLRGRGPGMPSGRSKSRLPMAEAKIAGGVERSDKN